MFIALLSLLIIEHFKQSEKLIKIANYDSSIIQSQLSISNLKDEIITYLDKNKDNLINNVDHPIFSIPIILSYGTISGLISIKRYNSLYNINISFVILFTKK